MMERKGRSSLFLMELIFAILIFSLCVSVCLQMFSASQSLMRDSRAYTRGVYLCESAAELFKAADGADDYRQRLGSDDLRQCYDLEWQPVDEADGTAYYALTVGLSEEQGVARAVVSLARLTDDEPFYSLEAVKYAPGEVWL